MQTRSQCIYSAVMANSKLDYSSQRFRAKFRSTISLQIVSPYGHGEFLLHKFGHSTYIKENCRYPITSFVCWKGSICALAIIREQSVVTHNSMFDRML